MKLNHIVCSSKNRVIGKNGGMPWHIPEDFKYFKSVTMGSAMIMGRKTFESIGKPLPGRLSIVLTREKEYGVPEGCFVAHDVDEAIKIAGDYAAKSASDDVFIIGGGELYRLTMPMVDRIYLTQIDRNVEGDTYYGPVNESEFTLKKKSDLTTERENLSFLVYERNERLLG